MDFSQSWQFWLATSLAALLLFLANSAIWVNQQIFNADNFSNTASTALLSESSRLALAAEITNRLYADRQVLQSVAGEPTTQFISGLLGSSMAANASREAINRLQIYMTSSDPQSIELDLRPIKETVQRVATVLNREENLPESSNVPDTILLVDANRVPSFYQLGVWFVWLAPLSLLGGLVLLALPYLQKRGRWDILAKQGGVLVIAGLLALSAGPLFKPPVLANFTSPNMRIVVDNIYDAFIASYNSQTALFILAGLVMLLVGGLWWANLRWNFIRSPK